jgi:predicted O-methyltransferase YrrM
VDALALVDSIPGWLLPEDAEKLYELARSTSGPILEVGTYHGKTAVLMASAMRDAECREHLYTVDVDRVAIKAAAAHAKAHDLADIIVFICGTLRAFARAYPHVRPALAFVDGDHSRAGVERDLAILKALVPSGGALVFHDFNDPLNDDPECEAIKVRPTVETSWVGRECRFQGVFGACGWFLRETSPLRNEVAIGDLRRLDGIREQYVHGLRHPAGRLFRRVLPKR